MNYNQFIKKPISNKVALFTIDKGFSYNIDEFIWIKEEPNIWKILYSNYEINTTYSYGEGAYGYFPYGSGGTGTIPKESDGRELLLQLDSLRIDTNNFIKTTSLANLRVTDTAYYFDISTQTLYVNFTDDTNWYDYDSITFTRTAGYSTHEGWYGGIFYKGLLLTVPNITTIKDPLYFGAVSFDGGSVTLNNSTGEFDTLGDDDIYGQVVRIIFGSLDIDFSEYKVVYTGFFETFNNSKNTTTINIRDPRKNISRSVPTAYFNITDYPNLEDDGSPIPLGYGTILKQPAICIDENTDEKSNYTFKFVDTSIHPIQSIDAVYVENKQVTIASTNILNGEFTLSGWNGSAYTVYEPGAEVTISYTGYDITNPLDIIEDLLFIYTGIGYTSDTYNQASWEAIKLLVPDVCLSVWDNPRPIIEIIRDLSTTVQGIFLIQKDGKFSFKLRDADKASVDTIQVIDQLSETIENNPYEEYTSSIRVGYSHRWYEDRYLYFIDNIKEEELFKKFKDYKEKPFKTLLTNQTDAEAFSAKIYDQFGGIFPTFTFNCKIQFLNLELEDNIDAYVWFGNNRIRAYKLEVIGLDINYTQGTQIITARYIREL